MSDTRRLTGERVFCHQCNHEWQRAQGGLTCPRCEGDFTEILEAEPEIEEEYGVQQPAPGLARDPLSNPAFPFHDHNPWDDLDDLDPNPRNNFTTFEFTNNGGGGRISFSTRSVRIGGHGNGINSRGMEPLPLPNTNPFAAGVFPPGAFPRDPHAPLQSGNLQDLFSLILHSMQPPGPINANTNNRRGQNLPPNPFDLLNQLFNPGNAQHGDMVFTQDAFDRVMTQLMDQNNAGNAPPPASEDAIRSLSKKKVDEEMLGNEGSAECSICMDNVELGQEVTVLPCKHWFHGDCVTAWLKEHDTCPHCRKPITNSEQPPSRQRRRSSIRPSSVSSPRGYGPEGSRYRDGVGIPESPSELHEARQSYYGSRSDPEIELPQPRRQTSSHSSRRHITRNSTSASGSSRNNNTGGGVTGWIRDHLPFS
ncbi:hypothetical protein EDD37DRAFT_36495 [Exophiala viscosa]|uniref:uncharacterized protein n=1 Tax=Exophiala viscosa TaxID=2486360 RepID=UPI00218E682F|nr:hypothetical protein EDD37DRAFT_36495 [Exophiala viscosa]